MDMQTYFENIPAGKSCEVKCKQGYLLEISNIALKANAEGNNKVTVSLNRNGKKYKLCMLDEAMNIFQVPTSIQIVEDESVIFEVRGKGEVTISGYTCCALDMDNDMEEEEDEEDDE